MIWNYHKPFKIDSIRSFGNTCMNCIIVTQSSKANNQFYYQHQQPKTRLKKPFITCFPYTKHTVIQTKTVFLFYRGHKHTAKKDIAHLTEKLLHQWKFQICKMILQSGYIVFMVRQDDSIVIKSLFTIAVCRQNICSNPSINSYMVMVTISSKK